MQLSESQEPPKSSWDTDFESMTQTPRPEVSESEYISEPEINRPLHKSPFLKFPVILMASLAGITAVAYLFFGGMFAPKEEPKVAQKTDDKASTLGISDQERLANSEAKGAMGGTDKAFASHLQPGASPSATTSPTTAKPTTPPAATKASPPVVMAKAPPPQPRIVYRTITPKASPTPIATASPQSFIPLGNGQQFQRRERRPRQQRQPLVASEKALLDSLKPKAKAAPAAPVGDPLIAGQTISVHLMSTLQFTNQAQAAMQVMLDQPLRTSGGGQIPRRSILLFQATVNPQNGAISAISGDAIYNGKTIRIQKGALSLEATNRERTTRSSLVAQSVNLKEGELATADRNNALMGVAGGIGEELTKGTSSVVVGNGSTIIQQGNNAPNIWGGALKGVSQSVLTDQRQRTQTRASQALTAPPIQSLPGNTPLLLTVTFPAPISFTR